MKNNNAEKSRFWEALRGRLKTFFTKNLAIKILSLVFAMLLWGYVLMTQNPQREKTISNVKVSIEGEADLTTRKLTIRGDRSALLDDISVRVKTQLTSYADLSADDIINVRSSTGQVVSYSPSQIEVEIDTLITHTVPVEVRKEGELPDGYWAGDVQLGSSVITLEGAATDLMQIAKAVGTIDLTDRTENVNQSMVLTLCDEDGNEIDSSILFGGLPTIVAKLEILPSKLVPIDVDAAIIGRDALPENFEIVSDGTSLENNLVRIVGDAEAIEKVTSLSLETLDVTGLTESVQQELAILVPEGVRIVGDSTVNVQVTIREKTGTLSFEELPIEIVGLARGQEASLNEELAELTFTGRVSQLAGITRGDITVYADVTGLTAGTHAVKLAVQMNGEDLPSDLQCTFTSADTVQVTIKE